MATETRLRVEAALSIDSTDWDVLTFDLEEQLSTVGRLRCTIVKYGHDQEQPLPSALLDKEAKFEVTRPDWGEQRWFHGIVVAADRLQNDEGVYETRVEIAPKIWQLGKRADCRLFRDKTAPDIVKDVLTDAGVPPDLQDWQVTGTYAERPQCVQYRETDLEFILRLLGEEGIYFSIQHDDAGEKVVISDDTSGLGDIDGDINLRYEDEVGLTGDQRMVSAVRRQHRVTPDKVFIRDYDPAKPSVDLEAEAESEDDGEHALEVYQYPGRFTEQDVADRYAQAILESLQAERDVVSGRTGTLALAPGLRFNVEQHPYEPLNRTYLVTGQRMRGSYRGQFEGTRRDVRDEFTCEWTAIPTDRSKYRPPRRSRAVAIPGAQTAITTGPDGEEIHVHEGGEVKAHYHWDRVNLPDDNSSDWMRTSQVPTGGSMLLPRMNWEVTVLHNEGDPDKPYVMGRMYNAETPPPYNLPDEKGSSSIQTATTPGGGSSNEIRMGDTAGDESMFMNASHDMSIDVRNNTTSSVGGNQTKAVGGGQKLNVTDSVKGTVGGSQSLTVSGNQKVTVATYMVDDVAGDHTLSIGGNRNMMVGGDHKRDVAANSTLTVNGNHIDLVVGDVTEKTLASYTHNVSAALIEITAANRSVMVGGMRNETTGALKLIGTAGGRGVEVSGVFTQMIGGAYIASVKGDLAEKAGATLTDTAAGAQFTKADNITFEADGMISLVMGASTLTVTPAMVMIAGVSLKLDGKVSDKAMTIDL